MKILRIFLLHLISFPFTHSGVNPDLKKVSLNDFDKCLAPVLEILKLPPHREENRIFIIDDAPSDRLFTETILTTEVSNGIGIFYLSINNAKSKNITNLQVSRVILSARKIRKASGPTTVIVVSKNISFLVSFGKWSLEKRLLGSRTKLLVVSRLTRTEVYQLLESSWTYSMMDAIVTNMDGYYVKYDVYGHLPYTSRGRNDTVKLATWTSEMGLQLTSELGLFPPKFGNFYGSVMPVTALSYPPYWIEEKTGERDASIIYSGTEFSLLKAIAYGLNFSIMVLPVTDWGQVTRTVELRESFVASVVHMLLPSRLEQFDFSFVHEFSDFSFSFLRPQVSPQWQSLYYPLSHNVWISTFGCFLVMLLCFIIIGRPMLSPFFDTQLSAHRAFQELLGILLGQSLSSCLPINLSGRSIVGTWLIFSFIVGSVYRGNLIAYLTLPKYPPRPETINELVDVADRVTMPPYGEAFKVFFSNSNSSAFRALGRLMAIVPSVTEGLKQSAYKRESFLDAKRYQEYYIAKDFMRSDGITQLYIGREALSPGHSAWPIPHDAPYTDVFRWMQMAVIGAGLYDQWHRDLLQKTMMETRRNMRRREQESGTDKTEASSDDSTVMPLSIIHLQGPLMLLLIGLNLALISLILEIIRVPLNPFSTRISA